MAMKRARGLRRLVLGALACAVLAAPALSTSGCSPGDVPSDLVNGLRVFAVTPDKSYANPGDTVTFKMSYHDTLLDADGNTRPLQILWFGGCANPPGDLYFGCFQQIAQTFQKVASSLGPPEPGQPPTLPPELQGLFGFGDTFETTVPLDILASRPAPEGGSKYGLMYVFFAACAGEIRFIELDPGGRAGFLPFACFDGDRRLPADSFVPGYTQIYTFEDGRTNENPAVEGMTLDGEPIPAPEEPVPPLKVARCPSTVDERRAVGCFAGDPYEGCKAYEIDIEIDPSVAEIDPGEQVDGKQIFEAVWVDYLVEAGDITGGGIRLVSGVTEGYKGEHQTMWIPPSEPGLYSIWGVVRDTRGGSSVVRRFIEVE
jgi:hypothetical protein